MHPTTTPEQAKTDTFAVFRDSPANQNLELIGRVEVPTHTQPSADGREMSKGEREKLAVYRAVTREESHIEGPDGYPLNETTLHQIDGEEFLIMRDVDKPMKFAPFTAESWYHDVWMPEEDD